MPAPPVAWGNHPSNAPVRQKPVAMSEQEFEILPSPMSFGIPVVNQHVELPREDAPDLPLSRLVLPRRPVVTDPFGEPGQGIGSDVPDRFFSLRPAIVISPGRGDYQPLSQRLAVILRLIVPRPKRDYTDRHQNRHRQNDENPSSAHGCSISKEAGDGKNRWYETDSEGLQRCREDR
jgi:hypothetical protein